MPREGDEVSTVGIFAGGLLALYGLTRLLHEDGSVLSRGLGLVLAAAGLLLVRTFWRHRGSGSSLSGTPADDRWWRLRMRVLHLLLRLQ